MLTQKYRSESDLVIWLLFGFEEIIVQVTDRECPLAHMRTIGIALLLCNRDITDGALPVRILYKILIIALVEEGSTLFEY